VSCAVVMSTECRTKPERDTEVTCLHRCHTDVTPLQ